MRILSGRIRRPALTEDADELLRRMREETFFDASGERRAGQGEYVVVLRPQITDDDRVDREARFEVHARGAENRWKLIKLLTK